MNRDVKSGNSIDMTMIGHIQQIDCWKQNLDWWQYIPRLIHEYSHNLLFGIARNEPLVFNDPEERDESPLRQDLRPMDGIYHALFVSAREALAMRAILSHPDEKKYTLVLKSWMHIVN